MVPRWRILSAGAATAVSVGLVMVPMSNAYASVHWGVRTINKFGCIGKLDLDERGSGKWYARGRFWVDPDWNTDCRVKLQRKKGSGAWKNSSSIGQIDNNTRTYNTGWHWDGHGYKARVCIEYITEERWYCSGSA